MTRTEIFHFTGGPRGVLPGSITASLACAAVQLAVNEAHVQRVRYISRNTRPAPTPASTTSIQSTSTTTSTVALSPKASVAEISQHILNRYFAQTPQRTFLLDAFMVYLVLVGGIQFVYCVIAGNYVRLPFYFFGHLVESVSFTNQMGKK